MFSVSNKQNLLVFLLFLFIPLNSKGQIPSEELKQKAQENFQLGQYSEACEFYEDLLGQYPKDPMLNYYSGICMYKTHRTDDAIRNLEIASSNPGVPSDVYFYLGKSYKKNYQFKKAKIAFQTHLNHARRGEIRQLGPEREIEKLSHAQKITRNYNPFEVLASSLFTFSDSGYISQVRGKGGSLTAKPVDLLSRNEEEGDLSSYFFMPKKPAKGDYVYIAGYSRPRKENTDLFRVRINGKNEMGDPEKLETLSSEYNEILPYFDPVGNDLYFASEGHESLGGYDVFKSHYDEERKQWGPPVSLGFPVNSTDNEYLVMPGPDLGTILLVTDRQGLDSMLTVYKLILQEPKKNLADADDEELKRIGNLGGITAIPSIVDITEAEKRDQKKKKTTMNLMENGTAEEKEPEAPAVSNIANALNYQKKADSLSMLAKEMRIKVHSMPNPDDRWAWQRKIIEWEKKSKDYNKKAEESFALLEESSEKKMASVNIPVTIEKDNEINGITVFKYTQVGDTHNESRSEQIEKNIMKTGKEGDRKKIKNPDFHPADEPGEIIQPPEENEDVNRFLILGKSPYNKDNPIPENVDIPTGPFYRIQLGVFSNRLDYDVFGGISPITAETVQGNIRYYAGKFNRYEYARDALNQIKKKGFGDAFIVSWYNGQKIAVDKVKVLEERDFDEK